MVKTISCTILTLLFLVSCGVTYDRENLNYYWERFNNTYHIRTDGFYVLNGKTENNFANIVIPFRNGTMYGFVDFNINSDSVCISYLKNKNISNYMPNNKYLWGVFVINKDSIKIQKLAVMNSGAIGGGFYKVTEKRGVILNDTTFLLSWFQNAGGEIKTIHERYEFIHCMPKPDSTNWMMEDRRLNNLLEEYRGDQELNN